METWTTADIPDQRGRLAIVTGATGGLGLETALALAGKGAEVILAARNPEKGAAAERLIHSRLPRARVRFDLLDLADLSAVAAFAARRLEDGRPIDLLINNAGVMAVPRRRTTVDGFEMQLGTNYLSHFALTGRLLPLLTAARARVVQLSSIAHRSGRIRLDDLNAERRYSPWSAYQQSKLAMLMFALELQRRSDRLDWRLTSVAAHPGFARTELIANGHAGGRPGLFARATRLLEAVASHSAADGAMPILMAATKPDVDPGGYYGPTGFQELKGPPGDAVARRQARDRHTVEALWAQSESLTGVRYV